MLIAVLFRIAWNRAGLPTGEMTVFTQISTAIQRGSGNA